MTFYISIVLIYSWVPEIWAYLSLKGAAVTIFDFQYNAFQCIGTLRVAFLM